MLFEFRIEDLYLQVKTKFVIIPSYLAIHKLYLEIETWTFHAPMVDEVIERMFGFYDHFDDLCFLFPNNFYNPSKFNPPNKEISFPNSQDSHFFPKLLPSRISPNFQ
jgi:hypothetical protein